MGLWKAAADAIRPMFRPAGTLIDGIQPGDWASPMQPITPVAPPGIGVRGWDFNPGINLQFTPRGDSPISFRDLRNMANSFDLCRLMIETMKDKIVTRPWSIRVKPLPGEKKKERLAREAKNTNVAAVTKLLKFPDGHYPFELWMRMWLEQMEVFDAPAVCPVRNLLGDVIGLRVISGATITPLVDEQGFVPQPPNPAYQQIILGVPTGNLTAAQRMLAEQSKRSLTTDQLIYWPRNPRVDSRWGYSPVEQIIVTLQIASNRQQFLRNYYTEGNVPEGFVFAPKEWTPVQIKDMQTWLDSKLAGNLRQKRRMIFAPGGGAGDGKGVIFSKDKALTDGTDEYLIKVVAFAFSVSPQNLIKQMNRASAQKSSEVSEEEGLEPRLKHIETFWNFTIERVLGLDDVEFAWQDKRDVDPLQQAQTDQIYINTGTYTRNEIREARGDDPRPEPEADQLLVTTATGAAPLDSFERQQQQQNDEPVEEPTGGRSTPAEKVSKKNSEIRFVAGELTAIAERHRQNLAGSALRFFERTKAKLAAKASAVGKLRKDADDQKREDEILAWLTQLEGDIDWQELAREIAPDLSAAAAQGVGEGAAQLNGLADEATVRQALSPAKAFAANRAAEMVGMKVADDGTLQPNPDARWAISETTRGDLEQIIAQAFDEAWPAAKLAEAIEQSQAFSQDRAELIARQEIGRAQAVGNLEAWIASGVIEAVRWQLSADHECCDICDSFASQGEVPPGHEFAPGIKCPPEAHPRCQCALVVKKVRKAS